MQIGDHIVFIKEGKKIWEGNKEHIMNTNNQDLNSFVFASEIFKRLKKSIG